MAEWRWLTTSTVIEPARELWSSQDYNYIYLFMYIHRSIVGLGEKRRTMGTSARNQLVMNPKSTLSEFKYFVGRSFSDPYIQKRRQSLSYDLEEIGKDGGVGIKV